MTRSSKWILVLSAPMLGACGEVASPEPDESSAQALVPFADLFAPTSYAAPKVSPDGRWLSWIAPVGGVTNFFVAPRSDLSAKKQLTFNDIQGIRPADVSGVVMYKWSTDSKFLIYPQDYGGDENWDIWRVDVETGEERNLTPSPGRSWLITLVSPKHPDEIAATASTFGKQDSVLYRLNLQSGEVSELARSDGSLYAVYPDFDYNPRVAVGISAAGQFQFLRSSDTGWEAIVTIAPEDLGALQGAGYQKISRISPDGRTLYTYSSAGRDTNALVAYDLETGETTTIAEDERVDLSGVMYDPMTMNPLAYAANWDRIEWHAIDESVSEDLGRVAANFPDGDFTLLDQSTDNRLWVLQFLFPDGPTRYYLFDRDTRETTELGVSSPELLDMQLSRMVPTIIDSSDGLPLISYYSLPVGSDSDGDFIPETPLPLVMIVHGGPSDERAMYAFGAFVQWLNNRGYAVYNMNYRGSAGFGKAYLNASNGEWGGKMHRDLLEQLDYAVEKGIADPERIGILGGSYGGYAVLVGMTMTPDVFACGVDLVGPSNVEVPMPHWAPARMAVFLGGDPRTEVGRAHLRSISPVTHAHQTRGDVLIGQGANDSRVPQDQSDEIVAIMDEAGVNVTYAVYGDEGHGFRRPENNRSFWGIAEVFLGQCLGGRYEPIGDKLNGSSVEAPIGAQHIPGLQEALANREPS